MSSSLFLLMDGFPPIPQSSVSSPAPLSPETTKFLYSSLHRVDNLVRRYHSMRQESNSQVNLLAHLSGRLDLLAHSNMSHSTRTVDYDHILCPPRLSLADRMSISLKENLDRVMNELDNSLMEMELLYSNVEDVLIAMCELGMKNYSADLERGVKHIQQVYFEVVAEVRARRALWYRFTADEKRKSFMAASTLGDILMTPPVEWDAFAKEWVALGGDQEQGTGEVDELTAAMGSWGKRADADGAMME